MAQTGGNIDFIENKGQWPGHVYFAGGIADGNMLLTEEGFTYFYTSAEDMESISEKRSRDWILTAQW